MHVNPFGRPRHKESAFLGFLEHQEIFRNFGDFQKKKLNFGGFLDDLEQKLFYILCRFIENSYEMKTLFNAMEH